MTRYKHLFFDLDHTLWDFDTNAQHTLEEIFVEFGLANKGIGNATVFIDRYKVVNDEMWAAYRANSISKETLRTERFANALRSFGIDDKQLSNAVADYYIHHSPRKTNLFAFTIETLEYLQSRYQLHIITNGFEEVQHIKLAESRLRPFFDRIVTSEAAGAKKPAQEIFLHALKQAGAKRKESLMIGDNLEADIIGARRVGMDQVFFNPKHVPHNERPTYEIDCLSKLSNML